MLRARDDLRSRVQGPRVEDLGSVQGLTGFKV